MFISIRISDFYFLFNSFLGKELMALLSQTPDETAKDSLIKDLKRQLLLRAAADLNCEKIFTGECATSLAITLLSGMKFSNLSSF